MSYALCILMLREKVCLQRLFECAFCTALISEIVWKQIPDDGFRYMNNSSSITIIVNVIIIIIIKLVVHLLLKV